MSLFGAVRERARFQAECLERNREEVRRTNTRIGLGLFVLGAAIYGVLAVISLMSAQFSMSTGMYLAEFAFLCAIIIGFVALRSRIRPEPFIYVVFVSLIACSAHGSAYMTPTYACVTVVFLLFLLPISVIDKSWRINVVVLVLALGYLVLVVPHKAAHLQPDEVVNCVIAALFGVVLGAAFRTSRLENFEMRRQAIRREHYDELTGLRSRRNLFERLAAYTKAPERLAGVAILMMDVDRFKHFNDAFGHQAGDACLQKIGACLSSFEAGRRVAFYRYGGEEFLGIAEGYGSFEARELCEELRRSVHDLGIRAAAGRSSMVTISVGVAFAEDGDDAADACTALLSRADVALYEAKRQGRNRTVLYAEGMSMDDPPPEAGIAGA